MQTGWTMIIRKSVPTCQILVLCLVLFSSWMSQNHFYPLALCHLFVRQSFADHSSFRTNGNLGFPNSGKNGLLTSVTKLDFSQNSWLNAVADNIISLLLCFFHSSTCCVTCKDAYFSCHVILTAFSTYKCLTLQHRRVSKMLPELLAPVY